MHPDVCSSFKQIPEYFPDTPYKAGTYIYYAKNYHASLLTLSLITTLLFSIFICGSRNSGLLHNAANMCLVQ